jgi:hypothetical protein
MAEPVAPARVPALDVDETPPFDQEAT